MGPKSKRKNTKPKTLASLQAQVASKSSSGSASPTSLAPENPTASTPSTEGTPSRPSSTVNHAAVSVDRNAPLTAEEQQRLHDHPEVFNESADSSSEQQPLLAAEQPVHSRNPHRSPTLPVPEDSVHAHDHPHLPNGHVHAPQSTVDSKSILHALPTSATPLKQSLGQGYGSTQVSDSNHGDQHEFHHGPHDANSPPLRPMTPPPIACKGVLITNESTKNKRKLIFVTVLCLCFFAVEMVGGYFAQSLALISDAFHLLSDVVSFMVSLIAIWLSEQPATKRHSFGYHRAEVLAALMSVFIIWILTAVLLMEALERIRNPKPIDGKAMCVVAAIGVGINIINKAVTAQKKEVNINVKAATLHVIGDLISSVGVLVASLIIMFKPSWTIVDPICTILFSILVMFTTYRLVLDSLGILMEGTPTHIDPEEIEASLLEIPGVVVVHDLHVWNLTAGKPSMAVHLQLGPVYPVTMQDLSMADYDRILTEAQNVVCGRFQIHHSTIQLETSSNSSEHCRPDMCSNEPVGSAAASARGVNNV
ncbi:hypothetical protein BGZ75_006663 [Mortierella antarctica]|nr:hypothetical protein BGZ75_006663 [Mortierella antarctica]